MKIKKSESYLIVSSAHLGISEDILKVFANVAKTFKAKVFHLGPTMSDVEMKEARKLTAQIERAADSLEYRADSMKDETKERAQAELDDLKADLERLSGRERGRASLLAGHFGDITFVVPDDGSTLKRSKTLKVIENETTLSRYLFLSGVQPVGDRCTMRPTNRNTIQFLKRHGQQYSWIVPHPVPAVIPYPRPGLNNVHNYYTVGCLRHTDKPKRRQDMYRASFLPAAIFVLVNPETDEFHAVHLHVDYTEGHGYGRSRPVVLYDGLCFTVNGVKEVGSDDRGVFITDDHEPNNDPGVLGCVRTLNEMFQPSTLINGGDASDMGPVNRHEMHLRGKQEGKRIDHALYGLKRLLAAQSNVDSIKERVLLDSNHHDWLTQYVDEHPELIGILDWDTLQKTMFADWRLIIRKEGRQETYSFGDYTLRHGDRESLEKAELMFRKGKYLCGHWHRHQAFRRAVAAGCGGQLAPEYCENSINAWQNQVTTLTRIDGVTAIAAKIILHDTRRDVSRFSYRDKIIETSHYRAK